MGARAIWAGNLKLASSNLPVKLYSAVQDQSIHFHVLEAKTRSRIQQHMVHPDSGDEVQPADIRKAYEVERGVFVFLDDKEIRSLEPKASRDIEITRFVPSGHISHLWYERPYYLGPSGSDRDYFAFVEALRNENREGIARWVMRKKAYAGALRVNGDHLVLVTLKHAGEILSDRDLPAPKSRGLTEKEIRMAGELVKTLEGRFDPKEFRDEYRDRVIEFVEAKARGKRPTLKAVRSKRASTSLAGDLAKSIAAMKSAGGRKERKVA